MTTAMEASETVEAKKKLTTRMRGYANDLQIRINEKKQDEKSGEDVPKLHFIKRILMWAWMQITRASAWLLDKIEGLCRYIANLLSAATEPVQTAYEKVKVWHQGVKEESPKQVAQAA